MIAVGYCRFSSDMQRDGYSIEAQQNAISKYCKDNAIKFLTFYVDEAISGTTDERPAFQQMIKDSSLKHFDTVIVHKLDRFSRNKYDSVIYKKKLRDCGVKLISVLEHLDDSPESGILESLLEGMSEYYSKNLSREVRKGQRVAASKGYVHGLIAPGYKKEENGKRIVVDEDKRDLIVKVFEMKARGEQSLKIFKYLKLNGIDLKYPKRVTDLIQNKIYKGVYCYAKRTDHTEEFTDVVEAIVSEELWNSANEQINRSYKRDRTYHNLLAGLLFCSKCGAHLNSTSNRKYRYYACSNRVGTHFDERGERIRFCSYPYVHAPELEQDVLNNVKQLLISESNINEIKDKVNNSIKLKNNDKDKERVSKNLKRINTQLSNLLELRLNNEIDKSVYSAKYKELTELKLQESIHLSSLHRDKETINCDISTVLAELGKLFDLSNTESHSEQRMLVNMVVDKIVMDNTGYTIYYRFDNLVKHYGYSLTKSERTSSHRQIMFATTYD